MKIKPSNTNDLSDKEFNPYEYAAIYARTSIKAENNSISNQIYDCKLKLDDENIKLYNVYQDKISGKKIHFNQRPGFKQLLSDMEADMFKTLIVSRRDRLSRREDDSVRLKRLFKKSNVRVIYVNEFELNNSSQDYISNFIDNMMIAIGSLEPDKISEKTAAGRKYIREKGLYSSGRKCPYGYTKSKKHVYIKHEDQAPIVRKIFNLYLKVNSKEYNNKNYKMKNLLEEINKLDSTKKFVHNTIYSIIDRPLYANLMLKDP
ncbi:recombinase family protein [Tepidibacter sp. Z1-5]|uniref:recombinase family protein n=1 Tax=Tepidibacter sp. Z1-5 TaxID=3134138 RepID=UPI0030BC8E73